MYIPNKIPALIFRVITLAGCGYGLVAMVRLFGGFQPGMLMFYTNISNVLVFAYMLASAVHTGVSIKTEGAKGEATLLPRVKYMLMLMITVTFLVYHFVLVPTLFTMVPDPDTMIGIQATIIHSLPDILVHYFTPIMLILDWLLFDKKGRIKWQDPFLWLILPCVYLVFVMIHAAVGAPLLPGNMRYPYFFLDVDAYGGWRVFGNAMACLGAFTALGFVFYGIDKVLE